MIGVASHHGAWHGCRTAPRTGYGKPAGLNDARALRHLVDGDCNEPGSWGPEEAEPLIAADGGWHNPMLDEGTT